MASGMLDKFIKEGKEYIFISNVENLGAVLDMSIKVLTLIYHECK